MHSPLVELIYQRLELSLVQLYHDGHGDDGGEHVYEHDAYDVYDVYDHAYDHAYDNDDDDGGDSGHYGNNNHHHIHNHRYNNDHDMDDKEHHSNNQGLHTQLNRLPLLKGSVLSIF